jgi:abhydrolase domain-containing protein 6
VAGNKRAVVAGAVMDALLRAPPLPLPMSDAAIRSLFAMRRFAARLVPRVARVRGFVIPYLEGGQGDPLVLVHGFSDDKDSFVDAVRPLTRHRRVILPDLLGFGEATQPTDFQYRLHSLAEVLAEFIEQVGLQRFDLGGNSLGAAVAIQLALMHPTRVRSLSLIAAAGVRMPRSSPLQEQLDAGHNPFVLRDVGEYRSWVRFVCEVPPSLPPAIEDHLARKFLDRAEMNARIMDDLLEGDEDLTPHLPDIHVPTLVLWGDRDRLVDVSAGRVIHREVPEARMVLMHGVGHCPQYEAPKQTAHLLQTFLHGTAR